MSIFGRRSPAAKKTRKTLGVLFCVFVALFFLFGGGCDNKILCKINSVDRFFSKMLSVYFWQRSFAEAPMMETMVTQDTQLPRLSEERVMARISTI